MARDENAKSEGSSFVPKLRFWDHRLSLPEVQFGPHEDKDVACVPDGFCSSVQVIWPSGLLCSVTLEIPALAPQSASTPSSLVLTEE